MCSRVWCAYVYGSVHVSVGPCMHTTACMWRLEINPPLTRYRNSLLSHSLVYWKLSGLWDSGEFLVSISNLTVKMLGPHISYHLYKFQSMPAYAAIYTPINSPAQVYMLGWQALYLLNHIHSTDFFFTCLPSFCCIITVSSFTPLSSWSYFVYNIFRNMTYDMILIYFT